MLHAPAWLTLDRAHLLRLMQDIAGPADSRDQRARGATANPRVLAAINAQEAHWFLPRDRAGPEVWGGSFVEVSSGDSGPSVNEIVELNPEILLTCWSTPTMPEAWLQSKDCRTRYICHLTGSVRHVVSRGFIERGGLVTNWGDIPSGAVAEHALLLALAALRAMPHWSEVFAEPKAAVGRMEKLNVRTLFGRRVGIHGFGQVARALVKLLAPFGVNICAYSPGVAAEIFFGAGVRPSRSLQELFSTSEVLFECEGLNPRTSGMIGEKELSALMDNAVFINVARAGLIDERALLREASSGRIRVALDVFSAEPLAPDSPWQKIPGVVLSPHIGGPTFDQYGSCTAAAVANVQRYLRGEKLQFLVTTEVYDRST